MLLCDEPGNGCEREDTPASAEVVSSRGRIKNDPDSQSHSRLFLSFFL